MSLLLRLRRAKRAGVIAVAAFVAADGALALVACSTTDPVVEDGVDATTETSVPDAAKDNIAPKPEEAGKEGGGNCSAAKGKCDIVLQDCPAQQECIVNNDSTTECRPVEASQQLPMGRSCCPNGAANPCLPGLTCVGNACADGGPQTGRCSPACCDGDDQACGKSDPEGISGACNLTLVRGDEQTPLHSVCTYAQRCKPFKVEPCKTGETCLVEDKVGTASCADSFGKLNRAPCTFGNECADGLICLNNGDAGSSCRTVCLRPGTTHPFDAAVEEGGPGMGGCPAAEECKIGVTDLPPWFGACSLKADGG